MRSLVASAIICAASFVRADLPNEVTLQGGATSTPDGFYVHVSTSQPPAMARENLHWLKFKIPHKLGKNTVGDCVVRLKGEQDETQAILRVTPYKTDKGHREDAFDIIAVLAAAQRMNLTIDYMGENEWKERIIAKRYNLQLRDYLPAAK